MTRRSERSCQDFSKRSSSVLRRKHTQKLTSNVLSHTCKIYQTEKVYPINIQVGKHVYLLLLLFICIERGKFLALDLGGTNFRVLLIHLKGESDFEMQSKIYAIPQSIMLGSGTQLFDHIAECLANFIKVIISKFESMSSDRN
jgi:hypothetical protein